jgi:hypothetical protein
MTKPIKRMILIIIIAIAFMLMACDNSQVNHWSKSDGALATVRCNRDAWMRSWVGKNDVFESCLAHTDTPLPF